MIDTMGPPVLVNGLNKTAILATKAMMREDPRFAANCPVVIHATWEKGVVKDSTGRIVCHPPPEIAKGEPQHPSMNSYCPLMASGCVALITMCRAAEQDMQFDSFEFNMSHEADISCFYKKSASGVNPWKDGIELNITFKGQETQEQVKEVIDLADSQCPSSEIMRREFPVEVADMKGRKVKMTDKTVYYDMDKYKQLSEQAEPVMIQQSSKGTWFCRNESKEFPGALMQYELPSDGHVKLPVSHEKPFASGTYATPVELCFFGGLSSYMHTVAVRLYVRGYLIKRIKGTFKTAMNKRMVMGVDEPRYIFLMGGEIELEIESDAPDEVLYQVQWEATEMSLTYVNWSNRVPVQINVRKQE
jgi:uncharacterized OsmC-like protein